MGVVLPIELSEGKLRLVVGDIEGLKSSNFHGPTIVCTS